MVRGQETDGARQFISVRALTPTLTLKRPAPTQEEVKAAKQRIAEQIALLKAKKAKAREEDRIGAITGEGADSAPIRITVRPFAPTPTLSLRTYAPEPQQEAPAVPTTERKVEKPQTQQTQTNAQQATGPQTRRESNSLSRLQTGMTGLRNMLQSSFRRTFGHTQKPQKQTKQNRQATINETTERFYVQPAPRNEPDTEIEDLIENITGAPSFSGLDNDEELTAAAAPPRISMRDREFFRNQEIVLHWVNMNRALAERQSYDERVVAYERSLGNSVQRMTVMLIDRNMNITLSNDPGADWLDDDLQTIQHQRREKYRALERDIMRETKARQQAGRPVVPPKKRKKTISCPTGLTK